MQNEVGVIQRYGGAQKYGHLGDKMLEGMIEEARRIRDDIRTSANRYLCTSRVP